MNWYEVLRRGAGKSGRGIIRKNGRLQRIEE